jgi:predicted O-linked N-acetylglucosamine transferase (SPINDLY family)
MNKQIQMMMSHAAEAFKLGNHEKSETALKKILRIYPDFGPALHIMGLIKAQSGHASEAIEYLKRALKINNQDISLLSNLSGVLINHQKLSEAIPYLETLLLLDPNYIDGRINYVICLTALSRHEEAFKILEQGLSLEPENIKLLMHKGMFLNRLNQFESAINSFKKVLMADEINFLALLELGYAFCMLNRYQESILVNEKAIKINPNDGRIYYNQAISLEGLGMHKEALEMIERGLIKAPDYADAFLMKGQILRSLNNLDDALIAIDKFVSMCPENLRGWVILSEVLRDLKNTEMALKAIETAITIFPTQPDVWFLKGNFEFLQKKYVDAVVSFNQALNLGAKNDYLKGLLINAKMAIAQWNNLDHLQYEVLNEVQQHQNTTPPLVMLPLVDDLVVQQMIAKLYGSEVTKAVKYTHKKKIHRNSKIRLGYFSSDLNGGHPVGRLLTELIELHNKDLFEINMFSFLRGEDNDPYYKRISSSCSQFVNLENLSDDEIVSKVHQYDLDIAIDLNGYTQNCRTPIFAAGLASIQVNFLGFPGTMGVDFMDYIVADKTLIPPTHQQYYTEKIAYLPDSYMMYESGRQFSAIEPTRRDLGLPEEAFIFCAFNNSFKITKEVLSAWASILLEIDHGILWMLDAGAEFKKNILKEFANLGVASERIIFAPRVEANEDHMSRIKHANLFLDAWNYNAHSTALDVLFSGVPLLTKIGKSFAARVSASFLITLEIPELIALDVNEYTSLAIDLAKDPVKLASLKARVSNPTLREKLFDSKRYTLALESLFVKMYDRNQQGLSPNHLSISESIVSTEN